MTPLDKLSQANRKAGLDYDNTAPEQDHLSQIKQALEAGPTEGPWEIQPHDDSESIFEVMANGYYVATAHDGVKGQCNAEENAAYIAACNPTAISSLIERLEAAERNLECAKQCALKYLEYLGIQNRKQGLERDMIDPDMVGEGLAATAAKPTD